MYEGSLVILIMTVIFFGMGYWSNVSNYSLSNHTHHVFVAQVSAEDKGRYKVRLESNSGDVKWAFVDVNVVQELGISTFVSF